MRRVLEGAPTPHPLAPTLPAVLATDDVVQRICAGLDEVLAPVITTLDNLPAYLDPRVAPSDFLAWLASWVGAADHPQWPVELRREAVVRAVELHRWRGTRRGLVEGLRLALGMHAEVSGDGGAAWSSTAGTDLPPEPPAETLVRVWPGREARVDERRVHEVVRAMCPVHIVCRVEILPGPPTDEGR